MFRVSYLLRVSLQDRPGSLGLLALQLGEVGADIIAMEVVERRAGQAVDDLVVDLAPGSLPDALITAAEKVDGVRVDSIRPYTGKLDTHRELELLDRIATGGDDRLQVLVDEAPRVLQVSWAMVVTASGERPGELGPVLTLQRSSAAPETPLRHADWLPLAAAVQFDVDDATWLPGPWREMAMRLAAAPVGDSGKALLLGRVGGPEFRPAEVARLGHLAGIVTTMLRD